MKIDAKRLHQLQSQTRETWLTNEAGHTLTLKHLPSSVEVTRSGTRSQHATRLEAFAVLGETLDALDSQKD